MLGYNWLCRVRNFYESRNYFVFCSPAIFPHRGIHVIHLPFIISVQSETSWFLITLNENNRLSKFCGPVCLHLEFITKNKNVYKPEILILNLTVEWILIFGFRDFAQCARWIYLRRFGSRFIGHNCMNRGMEPWSLHRSRKESETSNFAFLDPESFQFLIVSLFLELRPVNMGSTALREVHLAHREKSLKPKISKPEMFWKITSVMATCCTVFVEPWAKILQLVTFAGNLFVIVMFEFQNQMPLSLHMKAYLQLRNTIFKLIIIIITLCVLIVNFSH
jgi:hypothetical protein